MALLHIILTMLFSECLSLTYVDLSHSLHNDTMYWPTAIPVTVEVVAKGETAKGYWYEANNICLAEHAGTHIDAPAHFFKDRWHVDDIPLSRLMGPGVVLDIQEKAKKNPLAELTVDDITRWTEVNGPLPDGVVVFVLTGWGSRYGDKQAYFGSNSSDGSNLKFPGISVDAAKYLTALKTDSGLGVVGVGLDTPSLDNGASTTFPTHVELFKHNIYGLENVANLERLPTKGFHVTVMPMKIREGSGSPARIFASIPDAGDDACARYGARSGAVTYLAPVLLVLIAVVFIVTI
ncbi:isatin hydrolase-like [Penaeus monodon]|uniref:isatin hydrolase-like n=1 Tax=Penaeus monodon TaxID=6687 RepID=UPI0018A79B23|nr:isatin hydrolase-like [Penaeus monodon]